MELSMIVNGNAVSVEVDPDMPLLWVLRDVLGLTGTKFGCGVAACGACTVHVGDRAVRTCKLPVAVVAGKSITTIEGLARERLHPIQQAWITEQVPQCGYCQAGMIMTAAALLNAKPSPSDKDIDRTMTNICRCGTYQRVRRAIHRASTIANQQDL